MKAMNGGYSLIYADPAWQYRDAARAGDRGAAQKYPVMTLNALKALPVPALAAPDCVLAMWFVGPMMPEALEVVRAWGFTFVTSKGFTWRKLTKHGKEHIGMGHGTRGNTEDVLFARRGRLRRVSASVRQCLSAVKGAHSEKPDEVAARLVQLYGDVPRIELFARRALPGWDRWGHDAPDGPGKVVLQPAVWIRMDG